ncbi:MAG: alpha,alpha-trehalase TreF [Eudoraea sp.]
MTNLKYFSFFVLVFLILSGCREERKTEPFNYYESELFKDVQLTGIFEDSKTFVDLVPNSSYEAINEAYEKENLNEDFDLMTFVEENFSDKTTASLSFETDTTKNMYEHISSMWAKLKRGPDVKSPYSSRLALPKPYIVPGGRFKEIYYWDSYFTMEGLLVDGEEVLAQNMVDNFAYLIDTLGFIPNGTRNYYLSRSQPPFFSLMVHSLSRKDSTILLRYLPMIQKEYDFWMGGQEESIKTNSSNRHLYKIDKEVYLNRYWDSGNSPRPESYKEDYHLAGDLKTQESKEELYLNLRAGAASGWDFSSRWYTEEDSFESTKTADILAVDLNALLYFMEQQLAKGYRQQGLVDQSNEYESKASSRKDIMMELFWDEEAGFFQDYNFVKQEKTNQITLAGAFPLFFGMANEQQAAKVKEVLMRDFLKDGGLLTTLKNTGQQWDAPNGWAPLQWITVHGLLNYGYKEEAIEIMKRWLASNERVYSNTGKMMEKYNVEDISLLSGGGEYETQDGFGWTNGVALGFKTLLEEMGEDVIKK